MFARPDVSMGAVVAASAAALSKPSLVSAAEDKLQKADFLFVQSAKALRYDKLTNKLTLIAVTPMTVFFTVRPERLVGNMKTVPFVPPWSDGKESFRSVPPNADVSIFEDNALRQVVVELQDPELNGDNLTYSVKILSGDMPASGADISVFIDIIGRTLTPFSYAGVAWRSYRRAYYY